MSYIQNKVKLLSVVCSAAIFSGFGCDSFHPSVGPICQDSVCEDPENLGPETKLYAFKDQWSPEPREDAFLVVRNTPQGYYSLRFDLDLDAAIKTDESIYSLNIEVLPVVNGVVRNDLQHSFVFRKDEKTGARSVVFVYAAPRPITRKGITTTGWFRENKNLVLAGDVLATSDEALSVLDAVTAHRKADPTFKTPLDASLARRISALLYKAPTLRKDWKADL